MPPFARPPAGESTPRYRCVPGTDVPNLFPRVGGTVLETRPPSQREVLNATWDSWLSAAVRRTSGYVGSVAIGSHHDSTARRAASCPARASSAIGNAWWKG